jgi:hypothetical protein
MNRYRSLSTLVVASLLAACGASDPIDTTLGRATEASDTFFTSKAAIPPVDCSRQDCSVLGGFTPPFVEPVVFDRDPSTPASEQMAGASEVREVEARDHNNLPVRNPIRRVPTDDRCERLPDGRAVNCKPTAASVALLPDNRVLYFNALEGTENVEFSIVSEGGQVILNDQTRLLNMSEAEAQWTMPTPFDGGADEEAQCLIPGCLLNTDADEEIQNSGALFCADLIHLADGGVMAVGGTNYFFEPGFEIPVAEGTLGVVELQGLRSSRIFDATSNSWRQTGSMSFGRWYPSLAPLPNGDIFVASGVTKLLKPVYTEPDRVLQSGRNVVETETYDLACGSWSVNGPLAERSLPLYPRIHLLPNGQVYYNGGGQAFNPFGQAYDQALWNIVGAYDPQTRSWTDLGYAGLPLRLNEVGLEAITRALNPTNAELASAVMQTLTGLLGSLTDPAALTAVLGDLLAVPPTEALETALGAGFRGSTFSIMLPLRPDPNTGEYRKAEFLVGGGVVGAVTATSPGSYVTVPLSRIDTVNIAPDGSMQYESRLTGSMTEPRWYGTGVLLPTGEVMTFSGANRDEVVLPGTGASIRKAEMFDPVTETWREMATANKERTYHNTAMLLPDGRVLVAGHSPINTAYAYSINLPGLSPNDGRDPSMELYSPPYMFRDRPVIAAAPERVAAEQSVTVRTPDAEAIESVVLVRKTTLTHIVDGAQRNVELPIVSRDADGLTVSIPDARVLPPGPYMLFVNARDEQGLVPSVSTSVMVEAPARTCSAV